MGNLLGALENWVKLQDEYECFFFIADWHALTSDYEDTALVKDYTKEIMIDWLSAGLTPEKSTLFVQSQIKEHAELFLILGMITPVPWLERNPTYKEQVAQISNKSYSHMRVIILEFLDTDIFNISNEDCISFLDPLISGWDIDLSTFAMEIRLNDRLVPGRPKKFAFMETDFDLPGENEPGLTAFLQDSALSGDVSDEEVEFLKRLRFTGKRPAALYYYRALQNLRDPLHFQPA